MNITYTFDTENRIVFIKGCGSILQSDLPAQFQILADHPDFNRIDKILGDLTECDLTECDLTDMPAESLRYYAGLCRKKLGCLAAIALVAPGDYMFGLSRMFETYFDQPNLMVFRSMEEALSWLRRQSA